jgi:hypothetical protein
MAQDDDNVQPDPQHLEEMNKHKVLYKLLVEEVIMGQATIEDELTKDKPDPYYLMGQTELNAVFSSAAIVMENSGLIDDEDLLCWGCGGPLAEHDDGKGHVASKPKKPPIDKLN